MPRRRKQDTEELFDSVPVDPLDLFAHPSGGEASNAARAEAARKAAEDVEQWIRSRKHTPADSMRNAVREVEGMRATDDWTGATGRHFIALYASFHLKLYGVEAQELNGQERVHAVATANRMLARDFQGDPRRMVEFLRWAMAKERDTKEWRDKNGYPAKRLLWRWLFSPTKLTDYRVHLESTLKRRR